MKERLKRAVEKNLPVVMDLYRHLHSHPELSGQEANTAARAAQALGRAGLEVATGLGGRGVAGMLRNGCGRRLLIRGDMDALPVREETGAVGFTIGAEGGLVVAAGVAYLVTGKAGDVSDPRLVRRLTPFLWIGDGLGASTSAWLASRMDGQTSDWALNAAVTTVVTAAAFKYAGWPMTAETDARRRAMGRWRKLAPVWMSAVTATAIATATREMR